MEYSASRKARGAHRRDVVCWGLAGNDCQVHGDTGPGVEHGAGLVLVQSVSDTVDTGGLAPFLVAERPQIVPTMNSKIAGLYISSAIGEWLEFFHVEDNAYLL